MADYRKAFVGIDVTKFENAVSIAGACRDGEVRFFGEVDASDTSMRRVLQRIAAKSERIRFCCQADPSGYLTDALTRIAKGHPNRDIDQLLPWAYRTQDLKTVA